MNEKETVVNDSRKDESVKCQEVLDGSFTEEKIVIDELIPDGDGKKAAPGISWRLGFLTYYAKTAAFIQDQYYDKKYFTDASVESFIFFPDGTEISAGDSDLPLRTSKRIYLVRYVPGGMTVNPKTGMNQPMIDGQYPVVILRSFLRKNCVSLQIKDDAILSLRAAAAPAPTEPEPDVTYKTHRNSARQHARASDEQIERIRIKLAETLQNQPYVMPSVFPEIAKSAGIPNFRIYEDSVEAFLVRYLPEFELHKNVVIEETRYPGLITHKGIHLPKETSDAEKHSLDEMPVDSEKEEDALRTLDRLFAEGRYYDLLTSASLKKINFCDLPPEYQKKALDCAAALLYSDAGRSVDLNLFQRELISEPTTQDFIRRWKSGFNFSELMMEGCASSAIAALEIPFDNGYLGRLLNKVGSQNNKNDNYAGLTKRFAGCYNQLAPMFYFIRVCVQKSQASLEACIREYALLVKEVRKSDYYSKISPENRFYSFTEFLCALDRNVSRLSELPRALKAVLLSVYVDAGEMEEMRKIEILCDSVEYREGKSLSDLYFNSESFTKEQFSSLLAEHGSLQLIQKIISLIWEKYSDREILPDAFLKILCWVCLFESEASLDEVLRYRLDNRKFTKRHKQKQLVNSFSRVTEMVLEDLSMYALASYIGCIVVPDRMESSSSSEAAESLSRMWPEYSREVCCRALREYPLTGREDGEYVKLFPIFQSDRQSMMQLQKRYAEWHAEQRACHDLKEEEVPPLLEKLYANRAYEAFCDTFLLMDSHSLSAEDRREWTEKYILSLIELQRYAEAISYLREGTDLDRELRDSMLVRVIAENFRCNGMSPRAFSVFDGRFTTEQAADFLSEQLSGGGQYHIISALLALYCHNQHYIKALYLYYIYQSRAEKGFTRLYTQIRKVLQNVSGAASLSHHYDVMELAFHALDSDALMDFLLWSQRILVPEYKDYHPGHVFDFFFDQLQKNPKDPVVWEKFLGHLTKRVEINAWYIVVCETILADHLGIEEVRYTRSALRSVMRNRESKEMPYNFLPFAFQYIMRSSDISLCRDIISLLKKEEMVVCLMKENSWYDSYAVILSNFKTFCVERYSETGEEVFYSLLTEMDLSLEMEDLTDLVQTSGNKAHLFKQICRNYLTGQSVSETIQLLNDTEWKNLTEEDMAALKILQLIYRDDEALLLAEPLLTEEESVHRFKYDCASILSGYPEKEKLFAFDRSCMNLRHKLIVYSYIFEAIYDEDIYDKYELHYEGLCQDPSLRHPYLRFLTAAFYAQLKWNQNYNFFYKKWRYLKLFLAGTLLEGNAFTDERILKTMDRNGHTPSVFESAYRPFVLQVKEFWNEVCLTEEEKRYFLFALMEGQLGEFLPQKAETLLSLGDSQRMWVSSLIGALDYREVNLSLYRMLLPELSAGEFAAAVRLAGVISPYAADSLRALADVQDFPEAFRIFQQIALQEVPAESIRQALRLELPLFSKYQDMLIPLMCSRQFDFQIYGSIRQRMVKHSSHLQPLHYEQLTRYLAAYRPAEAKAVRGYLFALSACLNGDRAAARKILEETDIRRGIPEQWVSEAESIRDYAAGKREIFRPDHTIVDNSQMGGHREITFSFLTMLQARFALETKKLTKEEIGELLDTYQNVAASDWDRVHAGVALLVNYPEKEHKKLDLPPKNNFLLEVGLYAATAEINLAPEEQLSILAELYHGRELFHHETKIVERLSKVLGQSVKRGLPLTSWMQYAPVIHEYLEENRILLDFELLEKRILKPCIELFASEVSKEERYQGLSSLLCQTEGLESSYSRSVFEAIRRTCRQLEEGVRLYIEIINQDAQVTDGNVYFLIENIGKCAVSLRSREHNGSKDHIEYEEYYVVMRQKGHPDRRISIESIVDLQSGFITGGKAGLALSGSEQSVEVSFAVVHHESAERREILSRCSAALQPSHSYSDFQIRRRNRYETGKAVTDPDMLFGREDLIEDLKDMIPAGVTVIYGPSRIGKTSLLNWVRRSFASGKGNVMTVLFGGEGGLGKESDYLENFVNPEQPIPYEDDEKMTEYLLIHTIVESLTEKKRRLTGPVKEHLSEDLTHRLLSVLRDDSLRVIDRYAELEEVLAEEGIELWLLLDEFQQVVERWKNPKVSCEFVQVCSMLSYKKEEGHIKLVICGSDDLLRHMVLEDESVWRKAFPEESRLAVEPLKEKDFSAMIQEDKKLKGTNVAYSRAALKTLFSYTGGAALYGKEIGNAILEDIESCPERYQNRNILYASDVAEAAQRLLDQQNEELDTSAKEGIREIYDAVTKNLRPDSDMQYLWFMAKWLYTNAGQDGFDVRIFMAQGKLRDEKELYDSLAIAEARGIIRARNSEPGGRKIYVFRTIFYYFAFLGSASNNLDEKKIFLPAESDVDEPEQPEALTMIDRFGELSDRDQMTVLSSIYHQSLKPEAREDFRRSIGDQHYGDNVQGTKIGTQNNVQVNVQSITNIMNSILTADAGAGQVLLGIQSLPRLEQYLPPVESGAANPGETVSDVRLSRAIEDYVMDLEEGMEAGIEQNNTKLPPVWEILRMSEEDCEEWLSQYPIPSCFLESLQLAAQLELLFEKGEMGTSDENLDYSPVTIMYCKLIESLLKEYHTNSYCTALPDISTNLGSRSKRFKKITWGEMRRQPQEQRQKLTLGTFVYPITPSASLDRKEAAKNISSLAQDTPGSTKDWRLHAEFIREIRELRNPSAHGEKGRRISRQQMEKVTDQMFGEYGLVRLIQLVQEPV